MSKDRKYYKEKYPDWPDEEIELIMAMNATTPVATYTCVCGRIHEIEYTPPEHAWSASGLVCACGNKISFGTD